MDNLYYPELKPQEYLTSANTRVEIIRNIFKFRVRMAPFGENLRGGENHVMCPLCLKHWDSQVMSFQCEVLKDKMNIDCDMTDILSEKVTVENGKTITRMLKVREMETKDKLNS